MSQDVALPRALVLAGAAAIVVLAAAVAFLVGRSTASPAPAPVVVMQPAPASAASSVLPSASPASPPASPGASVGASTDAALRPSAPPPPQAGPTGPSAEEKTAVMEYFQRVELELASGKGFADPHKEAMGLLKDLSGSGVKTLALEQKRVRDRIEGITAPAPCAAHKAHLLAALDHGVRMLTELESSMAGGNMNALSGIAEDARTVEEEARKVDAEAAVLKKTYGIEDS